jgi:DNA repair protein RecO (recombination protein O)
MLQLSDEALLLSVDKYGDYDAIVVVLSHQHGLIRGIVKRGFSSKLRADLQPATLVQMVWKARLAEHMGSMTLEARHSFAPRVMHDPLKLAAVASVMALLSASLAERDAHAELYAQTVLFLQHVVAGSDPLIWLSEYVRLEMALLELAGFGLALHRCAATGTSEDLVYVSPKSGRAVSQAAGKPYATRLLALPEFLQGTRELPDSIEEMLQGLALTGHFLETRLLPALHRKPPAMRTHFEALLRRSFQTAKVASMGA